MGVGRWSAATAILLLILAIGGIPGIANGLLKEGLYISNKTDILFINNPEIHAERPISVYKQSGSITGLTYDKCTDQLFWSNIDIVNRGIYRGSLDEDGRVDNVTKIVDTDVLEVNGLSFDWVSKHLYWTDGRKKTIEISDADGGNRRVLVMTGRGSPRGIHADPISGHLFWTDQGQKHIARSNLDGSNRRVIVSESQGVKRPNQITVYDRTLHWVDSSDKTFESSDLNGGNRLTQSITAVAKNQDVFGLAIHDRRAYVTNWVNGQLIGVDTNGRNVAMGTQNLGTDRLFSAIYVKSSYQPKRDDPCASKNCAALCLPTGINVSRCACPSNGGRILGIDGRTCNTPTNPILFVAMADSGYVGFFDASDHSKRDFYTVGRSLRPVAVAYDPVNKNVFWSDIRERSVHVVNIDGRNHQILLRNIHGVGLVEGMLVDVTRRQLYYTNIGSVFINGTAYSWHRIETFSLRSSLTNVKVKTIVTTADKPRGLALDNTRGHLYYTDWGSRASIVRVNLDGSDPTLIKTGLDNPNGIVFVSDKIYFVDSHFKSREGTNGDGFSQGSRNGSVYSMDLNGSNLRDILASTGVKLRTPFGLTATASGLYVGDWETENLILLNTDGTLTQTIILQGTSGLMSLAYTPFTSNAGSDLCAGKPCRDACLSKSTTEASCTCNSYGGKSLDNSGDACAVPDKFLVVADMNSIKIVSQEGKDSNAYIAVQGKQPFVSNYVGLAFDDRNRIVYFSDISGRSINALHLSNMSSSLFFRINEVIDGMVYHEEYLYWTDYTNGRISRLRVRQPGNEELRRETLALKLNKPRGIRIHDNYIYWTQWGDTPQIQRMRLNERSTPERMYASLKLVWPNGLSIFNNKLYIVDGSTKKIYSCQLNPRDACQTIGGTEEALKHAYDLWAAVGGVFYYSDWVTGSIKAFDSGRPGKTWTIVEGLMRPTQFHFVPLSSVSAIPTCPSGTCSGGSCVPLWVNHGCDCQGKVPSYDLKNCTAVLATSCSSGGQSYPPDKTYKPSPCLNCRCLGRRSWANDPVYNDSVCERISCPKLNCGETQRLPNQCCLSCKTCSIRITNCPERPINLSLPQNQGYVVYDFLPTIKDCRGLAREVSTTRAPVGAIYKRGTTSVTVISRANDNDLAECRFQVVVNDDTPPIITCPGNVQKYLSAADSSVEVNWQPPTVIENDELDGQPEASTPWGSSFTQGTHNVSYTVKDKSGNPGRCSFLVTVIKLERTVEGNCKIPQIDNADVQCSVSGSLTLTCSIQKCQEKYKKVTNWSAICQKEDWSVPVTDAILKACIKIVHASVIGSLDVIAPAVCSQGVNLTYIRDFLKNSIAKNHVFFRSNVGSSQLEVKAKGCDHNSQKDLVIDISVAGLSSDGDRQNLTNEINEVLKKIRDDLERGFIRVPIHGTSGINIVQELNITTKNAAVGCLPGQISKESDECAVCGVGKYQEKSNNTCVNCPPNTYNDLEGQTVCTSCPQDTKSGTGSYIIDQCIAVPKDTISLLIPIAIGFGLFLLILFIIIIVCVRRRSDSKVLNDNSRVTVNNKVYDPDMDFDCTYDKIADPPLPEIPIASGNNYESLESAAAGAAAAENTYDKIVCDGEEGNEKGEACGGDENGDGNSTPPYLEPVKV